MRVLVDKKELMELARNNPEFLEELKNHFYPKPEIVKTLPNPKTVSEFKEVYIKQTDGSYVTYKMLDGSWYEVN